LSALLGVAVIAACSSDTSKLDGSMPPADSGTTGHPDASVTDTGVPTPDSGVMGQPDASQADAMPVYNYGTKLADIADPANPPGVLAMSTDETSLFFDDGTGEVFTVSSGGGTPADRGAGPDEVENGGATDWLWGLYGTPMSGAVPGFGNLSTIHVSGTATAAQVLAGVLVGETYVSPDGTLALVAANYRRQGTGATSTLTADLMSVSADGMMRHTLVHDFHLGPWVPGAMGALGFFGGPCAIKMAYTCSTTAVVAICPSADDMEVRELVAVDLVAGTSHVVAQNVFGFLRSKADRGTVTFADNAFHLYLADYRGMNVVPVAETSQVNDLVALGGNRVAYATGEFHLKVVSYPSGMPVELIGLGAKQLENASPDGNYLMFSNTVTQGAYDLRDLYLIGTSTAGAMPMPVTLTSQPTGLPGDSQFTADSGAALFYTDVDSNTLFGNANARPTAGNATSMLASNAYYLLAYQDPNGVLMMTNARTVNMTVIADLTVRRRDASGPPNVLVGDVFADGWFMFPKTKTKIIYKILSGPHVGMYVRDLPSS
jgi:hypothetical protein